MKALNNLFWISSHFILGHCCPKLLVSLLYWRSNRQWIDWKNPRTIDEKIQYLKFYGDSSMWPQLADKYAVREYVRQKGLEHILVPLLGRWEKTEDIDWSSLPNQFVMKTNHGSGDALICKDKSQLDTKYWTRFFTAQLKQKFGQTMGEPHYDKITPCIIAEQYLDSTKQQIVSSSPIDYKIWCFDGQPAYIWACYNRTKHGCVVGLYDLDWNFLPNYSVSLEHYVLADKPIPCPHHLQEMLRYAAELTKGFSVVRMDMYEIDDKVYFGEMTFTPASGSNTFYTKEFLNILGDLCKIK